MPEFACVGCGRISKGRYCESCAAQIANRRQRSERQRGSAAARGYGHRWRRTRARFLAAHPVCAIDGCSELATDAHHLDGLGPLGPDGHNEANLQALCHSHHSAITAGGMNAARS